MKNMMNKTYALFLLTFLLMLLIIFMLLASCSSNHNVRMVVLKDNKVEVSFENVKKFMLLPIQDNQPEKHLFIQAGDSYTNHYNVRLAQSRIDYYMPIELDRWPQKTAIKLTIDDANQDAIWKDSIYLSDKYDYLYAEKYRPLYHFTPPYGWMNDPNGMVYYMEQYHLFYQYNPYGTVWGNMHWGHAVSSNFFDWKYLPIALEPDSLGTIYSGSAVIDKDNSAGFGKNAMILFYTAAGDSQTQCMAYSTDGGFNFTKYNQNPILRHDSKPDFRDPKVIWYEPSKSWIMLVAAGDEIEFYNSKDLKNWSYLSSFGKMQGSHEGVWECPDLFELKIGRNSNNVKWVLLCNINPGGIQGGSATQYFIGTFNGKEFINDNSPKSIKWMDYGKDHYAAVTWSNIPKDRIVSIGWMNNWEYANLLPTIIFRSSKTVARELSLGMVNNELDLFSYPVREIEQIMGYSKDFKPLQIKKESVIHPIMDNNLGSYRIDMLINMGDENQLSIILANEMNEFVKIVLDKRRKQLSFNRNQSGITSFSKEFPCVMTAPLEATQLYDITLLVDKTSIELFVNGGALVMTNLIFPKKPYNLMSLKCKGESAEVKEMAVSLLKQTMKKSAFPSRSLLKSN